MQNIPDARRGVVEAPPSAAQPLAVGFVATVLGLLLTVAGGVLAQGDDDWYILTAVAFLGLVFGLVRLGEGIHLAVRTWERAMARH
jgi:hypothetical protein